jgi:hypothetical protein
VRLGRLQTFLARALAPVLPAGATTWESSRRRLTSAAATSYFLMWRLTPTRINGQRKIAKIPESTPRHPSMFLK